MKKTIVEILALLMFLPILCACGTDRVTDKEVEESYNKAQEALWWFSFSNLPFEDNPDNYEFQYTEVNEYHYHKVYFEGISTAKELKAYLNGLFSKEISDSLYTIDESDRYLDIDGELYGRLPDSAEMRDDLLITGREIFEHTDSKVVYRITADVLDEDNNVVDTLTYDFVYAIVDGKWVWTKIENIFEIKS